MAMMFQRWEACERVVKVGPRGGRGGRAGQGAADVGCGGAALPGEGELSSSYAVPGACLRSGWLTHGVERRVGARLGLGGDAGVTEGLLQGGSAAVSEVS